MSEKSTTPIAADSEGLPIHTLRVEVLEGPDAGTVCESSAERVSIGTADGNDLVLTDPTVSRYHVELVRQGRGFAIVDQSSTNGTIVGQAKVDRGMVAPGATLRLGRTAVRVGDGAHTRVELYAGESLGGLRGRGAAMRRLMAQMGKAAAADAAVLVVGESGTGKELIARALHDLGPRAAQPFETVDCASLTPTLVASELFGHERGAFTGAERQHVGAFERANGGTIFLDEVGELPSELQPMLLGALERWRFRRVGGRAEIEVDVRVISATNRDLRAEVNSNAFRLDLFYRLAVITLRVPPLRERPEDLLMLIAHFLRESGSDMDPTTLVPAAELEALGRYHWPGNVRELRNLVEATLAMGEVPPLAPGGAVATGGAANVDAIDVAGLLSRPYGEARAALLERFEARYLAHLLASSDGNVARAAREADMDRSHLFSLLRRHRLR